MNYTYLPTYFRPSFPLANIVIRYEWIRIDGSRFERINLVPSFGVGIVFHFWSNGTVSACSKKLDNVDVPECIVLSPLNIPMHAITRGSSTHLRVVFHPGMLSLLFHRVPMYIFQDQLPDAREELDAGLTDVYDQMEDSPSCYHMVKLIDNYLLSKLRGTSSRKPILPFALKFAQKFPGSMPSVSKLAAHLGLSVQYLSKLTRAQLGYSAKRTLSVIRFNKTLSALHGISETSLAQTAYDLGYHDQAHLSHEFKQYSGFSPGKYVKTRARRAISGKVDAFSSSGLYFDRKEL